MAFNAGEGGGICHGQKFGFYPEHYRNHCRLETVGQIFIQSIYKHIEKKTVACRVPMGSL